MDNQRAHDDRVIREISEIKTILNNNLPAIVKTQDQFRTLLYGRDGENGLKGVVSKHQSYWRAHFWLYGVFIVTGVGAAVAMVVK